MAKPDKKRIVTGDTCLNYVNNAIGFISTSTSLNSSTTLVVGTDTCTSFFDSNGENASQLVYPSYESRLNYIRYIEFIKYNHAERCCGLILGENDDGSYKIAILGSEDIIWGLGDIDNIEGATQDIIVNSPTVQLIDDTRYEYPALITYTESGTSNMSVAQIFDSWNGRIFYRDLPYDYTLDFHKKNSTSVSPRTFVITGKYQGANVNEGVKRYTLTKNKTNTLILGNPISEMINIDYNSHMFLYNTYTSIFDDWEGNIFDKMQNIYNEIALQSTVKPAYVQAEGNHGNIYPRPSFNKTGEYAGYEGKTHAFNFTPFNLILTRSESQAIAYVENGTLPSDAFLYPLDWENLPRTDGTPPGGDDGQNPPSDEDGVSGIDGEPTVDAVPAVTSNQINNNNLYWLQAGQLESFITWFWEHAGEIIELDDLWNRIQGLYQNLASAIINIRYYPVDTQYIGGIESTNNIIIGSVEMPIQGIYKLQKRKLTKRVLGRIDIKHKYNAFTDYSPYTELMLYLPFHGWLSLDIDLFMGNALEVRCVYDYITGTIQYGIYCISKGAEYLVNTAIGKMAVDIPITLQSKTERDNAIFANVTNAIAGLMSAGAGIATGNPIGLVMGTSALSGAQSQSAPIKVYGTQGENGSFFQPNKCAIYIKRPSYNRPKNYDKNVGYPSNTGGVLSSYSGFTTVYNPRITFSGNVNADGATIKPLQSEIEEIYSLLEKGVIL